ncbi:MAG: hypothetical protein KGQ59_07460, partial [Bdellovibrionales bacterium]|nr:hypothetical protein [Bdellovibrionales bacterium]
MGLSKGWKKKGLILAAVIASGIGFVRVAHEKWDSGWHQSKGRMLAGAREVPLGHGDPWYGGKPTLP